MHFDVVLIELVSPVHELVVDESGFGCVADHTQRPGYPFHDLLRRLFGSGFIRQDGLGIEGTK